MKRYIKALAIAAVIGAAFIGSAQFALGQISGGGGIGSAQYWKLVGTTLQPISSSWTVQQGAFFPGGFTDAATSTAQAKGDLIVAASSTAWRNLAVGSNGLCLVASSTATLGVSWQSCGAGISSLNGSTSSTQTFTLANSSNAFSIGTSNGVHTFTFPNNLAWFTNDSNFITLTSLSSTATGLTYNNGTGAFSWTAGYEGLTTASSSDWNSKAASSLTLTAGAGLTGGGDLSANRTFTVGAGTNIVVNTDDVAVTSTPAFTTISTTGTSTLATSGGNVGIATTTPAVELSVVGSSAISGNLKVSGNTVRGEEPIGADFLNTTTTPGNAYSQYIPYARTLYHFYCNTNGTSVTFGADERASTTPNTHGTNVFTGGTVTCDSDGFTTTTFANAGLAAGNKIVGYATGTLSNSTTSLSFDFQATND